MRKLVYASAMAIIAAGLVCTRVLAGGWAVVTLDHLPTQVIAGQPVTIGFMVRQHGVTPTNGFDPIVTASSLETGKSLRVVPKQSGPEGHYTADITFPSAGQWKWNVQTISLDQPMPPLTVLASAPAAAPLPEPVESSRSLLVPVIISALGWMLALAAIFLARRSRTAVTRLLVFLAMATGLVGFAWLAFEVSAPAARAASAPSNVQVNLVSSGQALFLAKGCVVCHQNQAAADLQGGFRGAQIGPNLTNLKLPPDFLHKWLKDPSAIKPGTAMPTLGLSDDEIDALVAFLTQSQSQGE